MWEEARPWEEQWESLKVNESKVEDQEIDDDDRQTRFWRHRPDGFVVNEKDLCFRIQMGGGHWCEVCVRDPETRGDSAP